MASLEIAGGPERIDPLLPGGEKSIDYTVTNRSSAPVNALLRPLPGGVADAGWLGIAGEFARLLEPGETTTATLRIRVPNDAATGEARFGLRATNENDANNDWADSAMGTVDIVREEEAIVPPPVARPAPSGGKFPLWIALAALVLVLGGGALLLAMGREEERSRMDVYLLNAGSDRPAVVDAIKLRTGYDHDRAVDLVRRGCGTLLIQNAEASLAEALQQGVNQAGGRAQIRAPQSPPPDASICPPPPAPPTPVPPRFSSVLLDNVGPNKISVIKVIRERTGNGLRRSKELTDPPYPTVIAHNVATSRANELAAALRRAGARVTVSAQTSSGGRPSLRVDMLDLGADRAELMRQLRNSGIREVDFEALTRSNGPQIMLETQDRALAERLERIAEGAGAQVRVMEGSDP